MMDAMPAEAGPRLSLQFSPRVLVRSRLIDAEGEVHEAGVKDRELRWQKGAIAVSILLVYTKLRAEEGAEEAPLLEGEQGSPARSLDNLLNKPGDWAEFMFGEVKGQPGIRHYVYRKKAVSGSNPHSALQWDAEALDPAQIEITRANEPVTTPEGLRELLRVLLEEFNPRRVEREWEQLFPAPMAAVPAATTPAPFPAEQPAGAELPSESPVAPVPAPSPRRLFPWIVAVMALAVAAFAWWRPAAEVEPAEETPTATSAPWFRASWSCSMHGI